MEDILSREEKLVRAFRALCSRYGYPPLPNEQVRGVRPLRGQPRTAPAGRGHYVYGHKRAAHGAQAGRHAVDSEEPHAAAGRERARLLRRERIPRAGQAAGLPGDYAGRARVSGRGGRLRRRRGRRDCPRRARRDRAGRRAGYYAHGLHKRPHRRRRGPGQGRGGDNARGVAAQRARCPGRMRRRRDIRRAGGAAVPRGGPLRAAEGEPARPRGAQRERPRPSVPSGSSRSSPGCWTPSGRWRA